MTPALSDLCCRSNYMFVIVFSPAETQLNMEAFSPKTAASVKIARKHYPALSVSGLNLLRGLDLCWRYWLEILAGGTGLEVLAGGTGWRFWVRSTGKRYWLEVLGALVPRGSLIDLFLRRRSQAQCKDP